MNVKSLGSSAMKVSQSMESLARTDDMLAVLGIIMLVGVIISAYGSFWQGRLASAQFKNQCSASQPPVSAQEEKNKTIRFTVIISVISLLIIGLMVYIFRKQFKDKITGVSAAA